MKAFLTREGVPEVKINLPDTEIEKLKSAEKFLIEKNLVPDLEFSLKTGTAYDNMRFIENYNSIKLFCEKNIPLETRHIEDSLGFYYQVFHLEVSLRACNLVDKALFLPELKVKIQQLMKDQFLEKGYFYTEIHKALSEIPGTAHSASQYLKERSSSFYSIDYESLIKASYFFKQIKPELITLFTEDKVNNIIEPLLRVIFPLEVTKEIMNLEIFDKEINFINKLGFNVWKYTDIYKRFNMSVDKWDKFPLFPKVEQR
jgi:hypothetical protein